MVRYLKYQPDTNHLSFKSKISPHSTSSSHFTGTSSTACLVDDSSYQVGRARASLLCSFASAFPACINIPEEQVRLGAGKPNSFFPGLQLQICREGSLILFSEEIGVYGPTTCTLTPSSTIVSATGCTISSEQTQTPLIHNNGQGQHYCQALQVAGFDERSECPGL